MVLLYRSSVLLSVVVSWEEDTELKRRRLHAGVVRLISRRASHFPCVNQHRHTSVTHTHPGGEGGGDDPRLPQRKRALRRRAGDITLSVGLLTGHVV